MINGGNRRLYRFVAAFIWVAAIAAIAYLSIIDLETVPPLTWDEGWTFSVARNWVERGFYGRLLMGAPAPAGLQASITVTAPVALAFRLLGVGIWQGRLVGLWCLLGAVTLLYLLARHLYDRTVANIAFAVLFLTATIFPQLHPIVAARQALAEVPMLFFLLGGYFCFYLVLSRSFWFMPMAVLLLAIGAITKAQAPPFLAVSLLVPLVLLVLSRRWNLACIITGALIAVFLTAEILGWLQRSMLLEARLTRPPLPEIYQVMAAVPDLQIRWLALEVSVFLLPTILGILYETRQSLSPGSWSMARSPAEMVRVTMLGFTASWLAWYMLLSNAYPRYAFPPVFVGSIFVAKLLRDLMDPKIQVFFRHKSRATDAGKFAHPSVTLDMLLALLVASVWSLSTLKMLQRVYIAESDGSVKQVAQFLNSKTPASAVVETYDSEVQFLLNRRYHYPPDQIHLDLIKRSFPGNYAKVRIDYDPLAADPDYLVVGEFIKGLRLYDPVLHADAFRLIQTMGQYDVYKRVR